MVRVLGSSAGLVGLALFAGCSRPAPPEEPVRAVKLVAVQPVADGPTQTYAADIRARVESRLGFRVGGKLLQRPAEVGQTVRAGQLLAVVDPQDYQSVAQAAEAQVAAARTQRDLAAADLQRFEGLRAQGFVSGAEIQRRQTTLAAAQAALDQAQAQAQVQGNQASYTRLLADADGVVVAVEAEPGQVVSAGVTIVRLARLGPRDAVLALPEDRVASVRLGQPAQVALWADSAHLLAGKVREVAASADPLTRTFTVKVALPVEATAPLGATATVRLGSAAADRTQPPPSAAFRLPAAALWQQGSGSAVWVFDATAGVVRARTVSVASVDGSDAVVTQGLQAGDEVVAAGTHVLSDGQPVVRYAGLAAQ